MLKVLLTVWLPSKNLRVITADPVRCRASLIDEEVGAFKRINKGICNELIPSDYTFLVVTKEGDDAVNGSNQSYCLVSLMRC